MLKLLSVRTAAILAVAVALFAVVGFAASFAINNGHNIVNAEGETLVIDCNEDGLVTVHKIDEWRDPVGDEGAHPDTAGFYVKNIQLHSIQGCANGLWATVVLTDVNGAKIAAISQQLPATLFDFSGSNVPIWKLYDIHVLFSEQQPAP